MTKLKTSLGSLNPYKPSNINATIKLDANEANYLPYDFSSLKVSVSNRYPDSDSSLLKEAIALDKQVSPKQVLIGSGSSELLELIVKTYLNPTEAVLSMAPSFVMYEKYTLYNNGTFLTVPVEEDNQVNIDHLIEKANQVEAKIIFLCTPNNPTGTVIRKEDIIKVLTKTKSIVVVDEAYMEFYDEDESVISLTKTYPNLFVARTFSKGYGLASLRVGYIISNEENIETLSIVKTPYNVSSLSQEIARYAIENKNQMIDFVQTIKQNRLMLYQAFKKQNMNVRNSQGNFLFVETTYPLYTFFLERDILIRAFPNNQYRITIPSKNELNKVLDAIKELSDENQRN